MIPCPYLYESEYLHNLCVKGHQTGAYLIDINVHMALLDDRLHNSLPDRFQNSITFYNYLLLKYFK